MPPVAPATESEALWQLCRRLEGHVRGLEERLDRIEDRDELGPLREQLRDLAREVAALGDDLRDLLATDRASAIEVLARRPRTPAPPRPVTSLGPPQAVRAHLRAWVGWAMVALAGATATALTAAFLALARGCG
jgi:hypothetical protein